MCVYGYCRISTPKQNIERQVRNIISAYPGAKIYKEAYTGKVIARPEFEKLMKRLAPGDTVVFDSVSRMSRNASEGFAVYFELYDREVNLIFLKEPHINSAVYRQAVSTELQLTGDIVDYILQGINRYMKALAAEQIKLAFSQSQKEVDDLRQRTREGIETARRAGKQIGQPAGAKLRVKKYITARKIIKKHSRTFGGSLSDDEVIQLCGVSRKTYYQYKKRLREEG